MFYIDQEKIMTKKSYSKTNLFIRSFIFWFYSNVTIAIYSLVCICSLIFPLAFRHKIIRAYLSVYFYVLKKVCHINYTVEGVENLPTNRTGVILSKHQSTFETFLFPLLFHTPAIIVKRELLWIPFFGWGLAVADPISINRKNKNSAMQQIITKGKKCLDAGRCVLIFPEGTRVAPGVVGHYKLGGARLAVATGHPVIPIAHNAGRFWPRRKFIKHPGTVQIVIGPPIETQGKTPEEVLSLTKDWIESTMLRIDSFVNKSSRK